MLASPNFAPCGNPFMTTSAVFQRRKSKILNPSMANSHRRSRRMIFLKSDWFHAALKVKASGSGFTDPEALTFNAAWNQSDLRNIIRRERRCELAIEGLRIFDLRRWKTAEVVMNGFPHGAKFGDASMDND